ncbi:MvaI/BcnI family restriction endonuclease [Peribacillus simplex]|uniref:MvaI/BcnI family restriction endonuclease n=1 Tax=Peribacillus simplex TaxID=1478 RepID=UPI002E1D36E9|nr:MvaI/BcnI family restriction endonuclease [Peribacillus simplex]
MEFIPKEREQVLLEKLTTIAHREYVLIRLTSTMLKKSIIDASASIRTLLKSQDLVDYDRMIPGEDKIILKTKVLTSKLNETKASFYRPKTKQGDPRFCVYNMRSYMRENEMFYMTVLNHELIIIPLVESLFNLKLVTGLFDTDSELDIKKELVKLLIDLKTKGPIKSVSPTRSNPKDIGETLERELGILPNSSKLADFKSKVEIKAKRHGTGTKDTLFSMVPNWTISKIQSANEMIRKYGYESKKYIGFQDLYVTVHSKPNNQGLKLEVDEENGYLRQVFVDQKGEEYETCVWDLDQIKKRLYSKHPETVWVVGKEVFINGEIYFIFDKVEYTRSPIFSSFLLLISQSQVTYDWRGRVKTDGTGYKDKGHCFRLNPKKRNLLFGETESIEM